MCLCTISTEPEKTGVVQKLTDAEKVLLGLDGYEFNVMTRSVDSYWAVFDMSADAETGDTMNDAVYGNIEGSHGSQRGFRLRDSAKLRYLQ